MAKGISHLMFVITFNNQKGRILEQHPEFTEWSTQTQAKEATCPSKVKVEQ